MTRKSYTNSCFLFGVNQNNFTDGKFSCIIITFEHELECDHSEQSHILYPVRKGWTRSCNQVSVSLFNLLLLILLVSISHLVFFP